MAKTRVAIGLMSGTSADGVTAALVGFNKNSAQVIRFKTTPYLPSLKSRILVGPHLNARELSRLNFELGEVFAKAANAIRGHTEVDVIGSHGQTIWHGPEENPPNTLQIAEASVIAEKTGLPVVADFRPRDIAAGGQGAPLVPAFDLFLFGAKQSKAVVNIGGIANISLIKNRQLKIAFDTGPGNVLIDEAIRRATLGRKEFDFNGQGAARGIADDKMLVRLLSHPYFKKLPPKSLDRFTFGPNFLKKYYPEITLPNLPNVLATLTEFTAQTISRAILSSSPRNLDIKEVIVSGGGAYNNHLMQRLSHLLAPLKVVSTEIFGLPVMAKEAACFAWMALQAIDRKPNHLPLTTGAKHPCILGKIIP